jgi:AcrR family transcriptional regulator
VTVDPPRPGPPRRRHVEVLEAAARAFHEKGYESTSIQDIAETMGIVKGSLYYYIRSKEDLLYEIIKAVHEDALVNIRDVDAMEGDALQKVRAFVTSNLIFNAENHTKMGIFFHDVRSLSGQRRQAIVEARDIYDELVRRLIREGQKEKIICPDIDPKSATFAIMGSLNWIYQWYMPDGTRTVDANGKEAADMIVNGLACTPDTHRPGHHSRVGVLHA